MVTVVGGRRLNDDHGMAGIAMRSKSLDRDTRCEIQVRMHWLWRCWSHWRIFFELF